MRQDLQGQFRAIGHGVTAGAGGRRGDGQLTAVDNGRARVAVGTRKRERAGTVLGQTARGITASRQGLGNGDVEILRVKNRAARLKLNNQEVVKEIPTVLRRLNGAAVEIQGADGKRISRG